MTIAIETKPATDMSKQAVSLFLTPQINAAKKVGKNITENIEHLQYVIQSAAYANEQKAIAASGDKTAAYRKAWIECGEHFSCWFMYDASKKKYKMNDNPTIKMELSAYVKMADNGFHYLTTDELQGMIATLKKQPQNARNLADNLVEPTPKETNPTSGNNQETGETTEPAPVETETEKQSDTRTKEELFQNFLQIWKAAGHGDFWKWMETVSDEKMAAMTKAATTKKAA